MVGEEGGEVGEDRQSVRLKSDVEAGVVSDAEGGSVWEPWVDAGVLRA